MLTVILAPDEPPPGSSITGELPSSPDIPRAVRPLAPLIFLCGFAASWTTLLTRLREPT